MSRENLEILRRGYAAWNSGDMETVFELADPEIEWRPTFGIGATVYLGHEGLARYRQEIDDAFEDFHTEIVGDATEVGDYVLVAAYARGRGRASGVPVDIRNTLLWTFSGGRIKAMRAYDDRAEALEAAGLQE